MDAIGLAGAMAIYGGLTVVEASSLEHAVAVQSAGAEVLLVVVISIALLLTHAIIVPLNVRRMTWSSAVTASLAVAAAYLVASAGLPPELLRSGDDASASCSGCVRLNMPANPARSVGFSFDDEQNLSNTQLSWRLRVRDFNDPVIVSLYAESGSGEEDRLSLGSFSLAAADGWQTFGADLAGVEAFRAATFIDGGDGAGGSGFDGGFPFDKSEVERIAVHFATSAAGIFTPLVVEIDAVRFSNHAELDRDFAANDGGLDVISLFDTPIAGAALVHVAE